MAVMDDVGNAVSGINFSGIGSGILQLIILLIVSAVAGAIIWYILLQQKYNKKIRVYKKVGGITTLVMEDVAVELKIGKAGDTVFHLKNSKKYLPRGKRLAGIVKGKEEYWYFIGHDGTWRNVGIEDIDEKLRELGVEYEDDNEKYGRASMQKLLKDNYDKVTFFQKYAGIIAYSGLIFITAIAVWLIADKMLDILQSVDRTMLIAQDIADLNREVLGGLDNVCSNSGIVKAG